MTNKEIVELNDEQLETVSGGLTRYIYYDGLQHGMAYAIVGGNGKRAKVHYIEPYDNHILVYYYVVVQKNGSWVNETGERKRKLLANFKTYVNVNDAVSV